MSRWCRRARRRRRCRGGQDPTAVDLGTGKAVRCGRGSADLEGPWTRLHRRSLARHLRPGQHARGRGRWWEETVKKATETDEWQKQMENAHLTTDYLPSEEFTKGVDDQADDTRRCCRRWVLLLDEHTGAPVDERWAGVSRPRPPGARRVLAPIAVVYAIELFDLPQTSPNQADIGPGPPQLILVLLVLLPSCSCESVAGVRRWRRADVTRKRTPIGPARGAGSTRQPGAHGGGRRRLSRIDDSARIHRGLQHVRRSTGGCVAGWRRYSGRRC